MEKARNGKLGFVKYGKYLWWLNPLYLCGFSTACSLVILICYNSELLATYGLATRWLTDRIVFVPKNTPISGLMLVIATSHVRAYLLLSEILWTEEPSICRSKMLSIRRLIPVTAMCSLGISIPLIGFHRPCWRVLMTFFFDHGFLLCPKQLCV